MTLQDYLGQLQPGEHFTVQSLKDARVEGWTIQQLNNLCVTKVKTKAPITKVQSGRIGTPAIWAKVS